MRLVPQPPPKGASRIEWQYYFRRNYLFNLAIALPLVALILAVGPTWLFITAFACYGISLAGLLVLLLQIRRDRHRSPER